MEKLGYTIYRKLYGWAGASCWAISTGATHHGALPALVRQQPDSQHESEYYQRLHESEGHGP
jgi:hypothetical protein